jgi:hypothetical protein
MVYGPGDGLAATAGWKHRRRVLSEAGAIRARAPSTGRLGFARRGGVRERNVQYARGQVSVHSVTP